MKSNVEKVLRAMDVIPPFGPSNTQAGHGADSARRASLSAKRQRPARDQAPGGAASRKPEEAAIERTTVPEFDLGEKILAEQRRMTAKKRRAPGTPEGKQSSPVIESSVPSRTPLALPCAEDLVQLQRIVAEIVARDIERLCTRPARMPS
ncbi:MAG: hypothetical protein JW993_17810 [Sedimentisphaerales bacterium]|nr:hypothetical protein [Sedimentisphaerales bacterium]